MKIAIEGYPVDSCKLLELVDKCLYSMSFIFAMAQLIELLYFFFPLLSIWMLLLFDRYVVITLRNISCNSVDTARDNARPNIEHLTLQYPC